MLRLIFRSLRQIPRGGPINYREEEKKILDTILDKDVYDNRIRPSGSNGTDAATIIVVNLYIRSFAKIDDVKMVGAMIELIGASLKTCSVSSNRNTACRLRSAKSGATSASATPTGFHTGI